MLSAVTVMLAVLTAPTDGWLGICPDRAWPARSTTRASCILMLSTS